jgi:hypothetical protein
VAQAAREIYHTVAVLAAAFPVAHVLSNPRLTPVSGGKPLMILLS